MPARTVAGRRGAVMALDPGRPTLWSARAPSLRAAPRKGWGGPSWRFPLRPPVSLVPPKTLATVTLAPLFLPSGRIPHPDFPAPLILPSPSFYGLHGVHCPFALVTFSSPEEMLRQESFWGGLGNGKPRVPPDCFWGDPDRSCLC